MAHNNERVATVSRFSDNTTKFETLRKQITSSDSVVMIKLTFCKN